MGVLLRLVIQWHPSAVGGLRVGKAAPAIGHYGKLRSEKNKAGARSATGLT
jgi:hypothetical protein